MGNVRNINLVKEFILKNHTEDFVEEFLDDQIRQMGGCNCPRCRADVLALTLNELPAHYVVSDLGRRLTKSLILSSQLQTEVISKLAENIKLVKEKPRH